MDKDIFNFITSETAAYLLPVGIMDDYEWNMYNHIRQSFFYKNSRYTKNHSDEKPFKNIIRPILNVQYRAEGFDVKDIELYVNEKKNYFKSFLVRKYHELWARKNNIDTFIDEMVESYVDYGGALVKNVNRERPEVVNLQSIAFCDQTDILSGPIGIRHFYNSDQLLEMADKGWGDSSNGATMTLEEAILTAKSWKNSLHTGQQSKTPGDYIEVIEVHGVMPNSYLGKEDEKYNRQIQIVVPNKQKGGVILFRKEMKEPLFKFVKRDPIYGRALGTGGAEEIFGPQIWVNYNEIRKKEMLDAASKIILKTTDSNLVQRHPTGAKNMENLEIIELERDTDLGQVDTFPRNLTPFVNWEISLENDARVTGGATDPLLGQSPSTGTPFKLQELVVNQGLSLHEYRKGKLATFLNEIYRDWVIPYIASEINKGQEFLSDLDLDELQQISETIVINQVNRTIVEKILNREIISDSDIEIWKQQAKDDFMFGGKKRFIEIFRGEFKNVPLDVKTNIVGKQKNLSAFTDKLVNVFRQIIINPAVLDDPRMAMIFNQILEASGMSPIDFYVKPQSKTPQEIKGMLGVGQAGQGVTQGTMGVNQGTMGLMANVVK